MIQIDRNLPCTHEHNLKAAEALGLVYSKSLGDWVPRRRKKRLSSGNSSNDTRWGKISKQEAVHCHR